MGWIASLLRDKTRRVTRGQSISREAATGANFGQIFIVLLWELFGGQP